MKTSPVATAPLGKLHLDVASLVDGARTSGPVVLLDDAGMPQAVILGFEDADDADDWLILNSPEGKASIERGIVDMAAGQMTSLEEARSEILGA
jgi:hypothetical protein